jgi:hypothetical protein
MAYILASRWQRWVGTRAKLLSYIFRPAGKPHDTHGEPAPTPTTATKSTSDRSRLLSKIDKHAGRDGTCWRWVGASNSAGYANICMGDTVTNAHTVAAKVLGGKKRGPGQEWHHTCSNRWCINRT